MSEADKLFEELGYEIIKNSDIFLIYEKKCMYIDKEIIFNMINKSVTIEDGEKNSQNISIQELIIIWLKSEELGCIDWIEE